MGINMVQQYENETNLYLETMYGHSNRGYICTVDNVLYWKQWHYRYDELKNNVEIKGKEEFFTSLNSFCSPKRRKEHLYVLSSLYVDIDYYKLGYTRDQVLYFLYEDYFGRKIPRPTFIIDSGNGIYLIWRIKSIPAKAHDLWRVLQDHFYNVLKEFGADPKCRDCTRVFRVPGSFNSGKKVKILDYFDFTYEIRDLQNNYLPLVYKKSEKPRKQKKSNHRPKLIPTQKNLLYNRIEDLRTLVELRDYNLFDLHVTENTLFLYRLWLLMYEQMEKGEVDTRKVLQEVLELNSKLSVPMPEQRVISRTKSAETKFLKDGGYKYKNETIIDELAISEEEQKSLKTIIGRKEKYRRKNDIRNSARRGSNGLTSRQTNKENNIYKIATLLCKNPDIKQSEIAKLLKLSKGTISKYVSIIKKNMEKFIAVLKKFPESASCINLHEVYVCNTSAYRGGGFGQARVLSVNTS